MMYSYQESKEGAIVSKKIKITLLSATRRSPRAAQGRHVPEGKEMKLTTRAKHDDMMILELLL